MKGIVDALKKIAAAEVLVGVTEESAPREGEKVNNAQLVYIHTHGSPLKGIPARPIIEPAIEAEDNKKYIAEDLADAAKALMDGKPTEARAALEAAGQTGEDAIKNWFLDPRNDWAPNSTKELGPWLAGKLSEKYGRKITPEMSYVEAKGSKDPLIDTGALKQAMKHVVKE
jgi:hypothetical protein